MELEDWLGQDARGRCCHLLDRDDDLRTHAVFGIGCVQRVAAVSQGVDAGIVPTESVVACLSPRWGLFPFTSYPRVAPWAAFLRRFAAVWLDSPSPIPVEIQPRGKTTLVRGCGSVGGFFFLLHSHYRDFGEAFGERWSFQLGCHAAHDVLGDDAVAAGVTLDADI